MPIMKVRRPDGGPGWNDENFIIAPDIPWAAFDRATARKWCLRNHRQTPERLRERGGLSPREAMCILTSTPLSQFAAVSDTDAAKWVCEFVEKFSG
jgi:hypothetical protein